MSGINNTHSIVVGYVMWLFGFFGLHRFYYGKKLTGALWALTFGLLLVGWIIDLFLIPEMDRRAELRYRPGPVDYNIAWILSIPLLGLFGLHRFYMGKWLTGLLWLVTFGLVGVGYIYDLFTLNEQVSEINSGYTAEPAVY
jgi:TM2 domain-containing membrane protein YozV